MQRRTDHSESTRRWFVRLSAISLLAALLGSCGLLGLGGEPTVASGELAGSIEEAMTLEAGNLYLVTDDVTVDAEVTIEEGAILEFASDVRFLIRDGSIQAVGTANDPIIMRGSTETAGFWRGIEIHSSDVTNVFEYVEIHHAGSSELNSDAKTAIMVEGFAAGVLGIEHVAVSDTVGYGLIVQDGGTLQSFSENTFSNIDGTPVRVAVEQLHKMDSNSTFDSSNTTNHVEVEGGTIADDVTWPALGGVPYFVNDTVTVNGDITVEAGTTVAFASAIRLIVNGGLIADGSSAEIVFTGETEQAGYWRGIEWNSSNVTNLLDNVEVSYAGHPNGFSGGYEANMLLDGFSGAQLTVRDSTISHGLAHGIVVESGATLTTEGSNTFTDIGDDNAGFEDILDEN